MVKAWNLGDSFWVSGPGNDMHHSYLISCLQAGEVWFLNASAMHKSPICLALQACRIAAFIRKDGRLCIAQILKSPPSRLVWHIVDPGTGEILSSVQKHMWTVANSSMTCMHHISSHQVLATIDSATLTIMDADTLQERAQCKIFPCHGSASHVGLELFSVQWSPDGTMLAMVLRSRKKSSERLLPSSEVHIYETSSGQQLQSVLVPAQYPTLQWSANKNLLAVYRRKAGSDDLGMRVMQPAGQSITEIPQHLANGRLWYNWHWTPGEPLLIGSGHGLCIFDPFTMNILLRYECATHHLSWAFLDLSWAAGLFSSTGGKAMAMCVRRHQELVQLVRGSNGDWQASYNLLEDATKWHDASIAPFGRHLVALMGDPADHSAYVCQYDLKTQQQHTVAQRVKHDGKFSWLMLDWAPTPAAWPQLYAYIHDTFPQPTGGQAAIGQSVVLVDSSTHRTLGSWKVKNGTHTAAFQGVSLDVKKVQQLKWSCDGKHLAVFCTDCVQVLTFGQTD